MSVVLFGYHNMGCIALNVLQELHIPVPAVFTHEDDPGENRWFDSLAEKSQQAGIPVFFPEDLDDPKWLSLVRELAPDILLSCYFRHMIQEEMLAIPRLAAVNLHGSLLPRYRGRCPVNWQIINGEREAGVTLHHMVRRADAGDIVGQRSVPVEDKDSALALFRKLEPAANDLLREAMPRLLNGTAPRIPQDHRRASYFGGRGPEDGRIHWNWPCRRIYNLIRAVTKPYPGAFTFLGRRKLMIWWAEPLDEEDVGVAAGTVLARGPEWLVQTGQGLLRLVEVGEADQSASETLPLSQLLRPGDQLS